MRYLFLMLALLLSQNILADEVKIPTISWQKAKAIIANPSQHSKELSQYKAKMKELRPRALPDSPNNLQINNAEVTNLINTKKPVPINKLLGAVQLKNSILDPQRALERAAKGVEAGDDAITNGVPK